MPLIVKGSASKVVPSAAPAKTSEPVVFTIVPTDVAPNADALVILKAPALIVVKPW